MIMKSLNSWRCAARLAAALATVALVSACVVHAQTPPTALFQNATLTSSGSTITATRVPVMISSTLIIYVDMTMQFNADANGNLTMAPGFPQIVPSPTLLTGNFKAGTYVAPSTMFGGKGLFTVDGPGVSDGGATAWSLATASGASSNTSPQSAAWYVGPIANNPYADRIKNAGITSTAYTYGIAYDGLCCGPGWGYGNSNGALIGVSRVGNTITMVSFTYGGNKDTSTPVSQMTLTLVQ